MRYGKQKRSIFLGQFIAYLVMLGVIGAVARGASIFKLWPLLGLSSIFLSSVALAKNEMFEYVVTTENELLFMRDKILVNSYSLADLKFTHRKKGIDLYTSEKSFTHIDSKMIKNFKEFVSSLKNNGAKEVVKDYTPAFWLKAMVSGIIMFIAIFTFGIVASLVWDAYTSNNLALLFTPLFGITGAGLLLLGIGFFILALYLFKKK